MVLTWGAATLAVALAAVGAAVAARIGPVDNPGARASHVRPTRTSGGLAVMGAVALCAALLALDWRGAAGLEAALALLAALAFGALGAADDFRGLGAGLKLGLGALAAVAVAALLPPIAALPLAPGLSLPLAPWLGVAGSALWLVTATNAVNFVDGANGFAPGGLIVAFAALAGGAALGGGGAVSALALAAAAAYAGFLPWNLSGRLFQGDAGSLFGGFLFAALHLAGTAQGALPLYFGPLVLLPWLTDVLLTLLRRARGGRPLLDAHREHLYQRWLQATGRGHLALAWRNGVVCGAAAALAVLMCAAPRGWQGAIFLLALAACVAGWALVSRRLDRALAAHG